jgi:hypothetical protein
VIVLEQLDDVRHSNSRKVAVERKCPSSGVPGSVVRKPDGVRLRA